MAIGIAWFCLIAAMAVLVVAMIAMFVVDDWTIVMIPSLILTGVLLVVAMASWGIGELNDPHKGVIIEKRFEPKHLVCSKGCFPVKDKWYFVLDDNGNKGDRNVSHSTYNRLSVGDYYNG